MVDTTGLDKGKVIVEGSDYLMDIGRPSKKKRVDHLDAYKISMDSVGEDRVEKDYKLFLLELEAFVERHNENNDDTDTQEAEDFDPHYKLFYQNLKPRGTAYVLEIERGNYTMVVKYEDEDEDEFQSFDERRRKDPYPRWKSLRKNRHNFGSEDAALRDKKGKWESRDDKMDETYSVFLSGLTIVGESLVFVDKDGTQHRFDESTDDSTSDSDTEGSAKPSLFGSEKTPSTSKKTVWSSDKMASSNQRGIESSSSGFRQGVMDIIAKPYDPTEHENLLAQAERRKPIVRNRETRQRNVRFVDEGKLGKSYLDHHYDLKKKIKAAERDGRPHEVLLLLRGFFFWLQHLSDEDQFMPWRDDLWLKQCRRVLTRNY